MQKENWEINVILRAPDDCDECPCEEILTPALNSAVEGFVFLARNVMGPETTKHVIAVLEAAFFTEDCRPAVDMLYAMFSAAGMKPVADEIRKVIYLGSEDANVYGLFMDMFFDDEEIDWYLVENWLDEYSKEESNGQMQNNRYM